MPMVAGWVVIRFLCSIRRNTMTTENANVLLLQLDIDDETGIMFGDSGNCTFLISREALQKCDFSEVEYDWQCC